MTNKTFDKRVRAVIAAQKELGAKAVEGTNFKLVKDGKRWTWEAIVTEKPAKTAKEAKEKAALRPDGLRPGTGLAILVDTVCRDKGATNAELCEAVGWKQCLPMMRKACDKAGVTLKVERAPGKMARYFGTTSKSATK